MPKKSILVCALFLLSLPAVVWGATFAVTTIEELETALATAESNAGNDIINISAGTYTLTGALTYDLPPGSTENYSLTIQSVGGEVILDGNSLQTLRIETLVSGEDTSSADITIKGIIFKNGRISVSSLVGAGLCVWTQNSDILIEDCKFINNIASAIYQDPSGGGAFVKAAGNGTGTITGCTFTDNRANSVGGGLYTNSGTIILTNSVFQGNECSTYGAGAYIYPSSSATITNNTFSENDNGTWAGGTGGGLHVQMYNDTVTADIYNNIIWGNTAYSENGSDIYLETDAGNNGVGATVNVYNNIYTDLDCSDTDNLTLSANIDQDPLLAHNLRIQTGSPCIGAGLDAAPSVPADDIDDQARVSVIDIGADEYVASADIVVSPSPVAFGNVTLNSSSTKTVTLSNAGELDLSVTNIAISGTDAALFALDVDGGSNPVGSTSPTIASSGSGTVTVTFTPTTDSGKAAILDITSNDPDEPTAHVSLTGNGATIAVADIDVTDAIAPTDDLQMAFGSVTAGASSSAKTVTVSNTGNASLTVSTIAVSGTDASDFALDVNGGSNPLGSTSPTIAAGGSGTLTITFSPATSGSKTASLDIASSDTDETPLNVALSGTGSVTAVADINVTDDVAPVTDLQMNFGSIETGTSSLAKTVTISNEGNATLTVSAIAISGTDAADFTLTGSITTVAAGSSETVTVTFSPAAAGAKSAALTITSDDSDEASVNVALSGTGSATAIPDIDVTDDVTPATDLEMAFGSITTGSSSAAKAVIIYNGGTATLTIGSIALSGTDASEFTLDTSSAASTVATGSSTTVTVTFSPAADGSKTAALVITSDDPDEATVNVSLTGTGAAAAAAAASGGGGGGGGCFLSGM